MKRVFFLRDRDLQSKGQPCFCVELWAGDRRLQRSVFGDKDDARTNAQAIAALENCKILEAL